MNTISNLIVADAWVIRLMIYLVLCTGLFYASFCRAVWTTEETRPGLRFVVMLIGVVACLAFAAPFTWGYRPDWVTILVLWGWCTSQATLSMYWTHSQGVPPELATKARRATDFSLLT